MKKLLSIFLLSAFLLPSASFASEGLFYFFDNVYGLSDFKSNSEQIDIVAPQVYEVDYDLSVSKLKSKKIIQESKKRGVATMPLLVNNDFSKPLMTDLLNNSEAQDKIIEFMIKEGKYRKYVGWQFDFENLNHLDRDLYTAFVKKTYTKMKENDLKFSVAVIVRSNDYNKNDTRQDWSSGYDYKKLADNSDFLSLMTYDDPNSVGPVASIPYVNKILDYMLTKAPAEKLSLGIPFYCWQWRDGEKVNSTTYTLAKKVYKKGKNKETGFDEELGAEYFKYTKDGQENIIWCDSARSFEMKSNIIDAKGLRGFSVWALGQGDKEIWNFLKNK